MWQARAKTRPKADEYEDINEDVFKHYDNKFFDMDSMAEDSKPSTIPVPEIQVKLKENVSTVMIWDGVDAEKVKRHAL